MIVSERTEITISPALFVKSSHIPVENLIKPVLKQMDISRWTCLKTKYEELIKYEKDLVKISGDGYCGIMNDELEEIAKEAEKVMVGFEGEVKEKIIEGFFSYDKSTIHDLSIQKTFGVKSFLKWDVKNPATAFDLFGSLDLIFALGGRFYQK